MSIIIPPFVGSPTAAPASGGVLAYDETWLREPRLLVPGMQPIGPVKIDWVNPITAKLNFCWYGKSRELISGSIPTVTTSDNRLYDGLGAYWQLDSTTAELTIPNRIAAAAVKTTSASLFVYMSAFTVGVNSDPFCRIGNLAIVSEHLNNTFLSGRVYEDYWGSTTTANIAVPSTPFVPILISRRGTTTGYAVAIKIFGVSQVETTKGEGGNVLAKDATIAETANFSAGKVYCAFHWSRLLTDTEFNSLSLDPYQFLIPA